MKFHGSLIEKKLLLRHKEKERSEEMRQDGGLEA